MTSTQLRKQDNKENQDYINIIEKIITSGDIKNLTPAQRVKYYEDLCKSLGLNPLTRPFEYIILGNKLTLYARKDATEQLRKIRNVSITKIEKETFDGVFAVTVHVKDGDGRTDVSTGVVSIANLSGDALANAFMKAETKAKRRATLSIVGLGLLDETETETIPGAKLVDGEVIEGQAEVINHKPELKIIENKIDEQLEQYLKQLELIKDIDDLKTVFCNAAKVYKNNDNAMERLINLKDIRKSELMQE